MADSKSYKLVIFGEHYTIVSDETEHHVHSVSQLIDGLMKEVKAKMPQATAEKAAVLVALQLASQLNHSKDVISSYQHQHELLVAKVDAELQQ